MNDGDNTAYRRRQGPYEGDADLDRSQKSLGLFEEPLDSPRRRVPRS